MECFYEDAITRFEETSDIKLTVWERCSSLDRNVEEWFCDFSNS